MLSSQERHRGMACTLNRNRWKKKRLLWERFQGLLVTKGTGEKELLKGDPVYVRDLALSFCSSSQR